MSENSIVSLTTEYGNNSPYTATLKGKLLTLKSGLTMIDISHEVIPNDILAASYLLKTAAMFFPERTIHLVAVDVNIRKYEQVLLVHYKGQYMVCSDNGLFSIILKNEDADIYAIDLQNQEIHPAFPELDIFPHIVNALLQGKKPEELGHKTTLKTIRETLTPVIEGNMIKGSIIFIDGYQNIITDITRHEFDQMQEKWSKFAILYRKKSGIKVLSEHYDDEKGGEVVAIINRYGYLEIAIKQGRAKSLLGLQAGGSILIEFYD